jgi:hypothetical protein
VNAALLYFAVPALLSIIELPRLLRHGNRRELACFFILLALGIVMSVFIVIHVVPTRPFFGLGIVLEPVGQWLQTLFAIDAGGSSS